jgi:hypothetical protein
MGIDEIENLKDCNELDMLYKIIDIAESAKKRTEEVLSNNKQAGIDVRKKMQDIRLLAAIIRNKIVLRRGKGNDKRPDRLNAAIEREIKRIEQEDRKIENLEKRRLGLI